MKRTERVVLALALIVSACFTSSCAPRHRGEIRSRPERYGLLVQRARSGFEPPTSPRAQAVVAFAMSQVGKPYCWGGTGPRCFDCSGLVQVAWRAYGARLPRTSSDIADRLPEVSLQEVRAGDILWWPGHVGIYAGNGWMVDAYDSRHGVVQRPAIDPRRAFRPIDDPIPNGG